MKKGYLYIAIATLMFSTMEIALKFISGQFHPLQLSITRFLLGGLFLIPLAMGALKKKRIRLTTSDLQSFVVLGFIGIAVSMTFYQLAVVYAQASVVAVLFSSNPVFVTFFAYLFLHEVIYPRNVAALLLELAGIVIIINPLHTELNLTGVLLTLLATVTFALYGVLGKKKCASLGGVVVTCGSFLMGSLELLLLVGLCRIPLFAAALADGPLSLFVDVPLLSGYSASTVPIILYISLGVTGLGYACYFLAMEATSANTTSLIFFFKPALAPLLAMVLLQESIPWNMTLGILFILTGSIASIYPTLRKETSL